MSIRRSLLLSLADSYLGLLLQVASTVIIARLLTPAEVGVFAVAAVFAALASSFRDFGVAEYLIQERELTNERIAAALALNIIVSWSMALALFVGAPLASRFYDTPGIQPVMWVLSMNFLLVPFGAVTQAWFRRELNYRPIVICNLVSNLTAFAVAVGLACSGMGTMSLAWSSFAGIVATVATVAWFRPSHFPRWPTLKGIGHVFHFGKFASAVYLTSQLGKGAPELIIGKSMTMADVGMFSRANGLVEMFHRLLLRPVLQVCMPYFAKAQRERGALVDAYLQSVSMLTAVGWPFLSFLALAAYAAIRIVYGDQWVQAVPLAQVLCMACAIELVFLLSREALFACGDARRANSLQIGLVVLQVLGLGLAFPLGLAGAAWGLLGAAAAGVLLSQWHLHKGIGLSARALLRHCAPSLVLAAGSVAPAWLWARWSPVGEDNFVGFGLGAGCLTLASWLVGLRWMHHPLWDELASAAARVAHRWSGRNGQRPQDRE